MRFFRPNTTNIAKAAISCAALLILFVQTAVAAELARHDSHSIELNERILRFEDGMLLGNGDLSVSVYQSADRIIWRFGKSDVWDRRLDMSDELFSPYSLTQPGTNTGRLSARVE